MKIGALVYYELENEKRRFGIVVRPSGTISTYVYWFYSNQVKWLMNEKLIVVEDD